MRLNRTMAVVVVAVVLSLAGSVLASRVSITTTNSLRYRVFFIVGVAETVKRGDYVMFDFKLEDGSTVKVIKEVACVSGDYLITDLQNREYYCYAQGELHYIGRAKTVGLKGQPLRPFIYTGRIPEGMVFVAGHSVHSYDSRYYGFISTKGVRRVLPVF